MDKEKDKSLCDSASCNKPAVSLVVTRRVRVSDEHVITTEVCWDRETRPERGWSQASEYCGKHRDQLLLDLGRVLG